MLSSVLIIGLAGLAFGVIHTAMAALRVKERARRRWGAPRVDQWYRLVYSSAAIVTFLPVLILAQVLPDRTIYVISSPWVWLTSGLQLVALIVFLAALLQTDVWRFIGLRQLVLGGDPIPADQHERLVTSGPYAWVRHPLYSTAIALMWLWPDMTVNRATVFAVSTVYFYLGSIPEERKLVREFGEAYQRYQALVPRLIPWRGQVYRQNH